jgi:hypothetical protein
MLFSFFKKEEEEEEKPFFQFRIQGYPGWYTKFVTSPAKPWRVLLLYLTPHPHSHTQRPTPKPSASQPYPLRRARLQSAR